MIASLVLGASFVMLAPPQEIQHSIDVFVRSAPGAVVAVGVLDRGKTETYFAGTPPKGAPKLDTSTVFQIGSISKTFTSTILADMALRHQVNLDDPIEKYLPPGTRAPTLRAAHITLLNLAEQNSGLPRLPTNIRPANIGDPYADYSRSDLYDFLGRYELTRTPGAQFEYSNVGVGLLGTLLANAAHTSYPQLLEHRVLKPLGMHDTSATVTSAVAARMMPGFSSAMETVPPWTFTSLAGAGAINSNLHDMLIYLQANMNAPSGPLGAAMALAQEPRTAGLPMQKIGLNWMVAPSGVVWHNGETGGYSSMVEFSRADGIGVVLLTNIAADDGLTDALAAHILESQRYPTAPVLPAAIRPHGNSPYAGVYQLQPTFKITIYEDGGILYGRATGQPAVILTLNSGATYKVEGVDATITFNRDASGKVTSLVLHQNGIDQTAELIEAPQHR